MTREELLKPRYKVTADYPGSPYHKDLILEFNQQGQPLSEKGWCRQFDTYPHLFRKLEWWEERGLGEMPEYIKYWDISLNFPVDRVCRGDEAPFNSYKFTADNFQPATKEEYEYYTASLTTNKE